MMELHGVLYRNVPSVWPVVLPMVEKAIEYAHGELEADDVLNALLNRDMQLWVVLDGRVVRAVTITEISSFPRLKVCRVLMVAGDEMDKWVDLVDVIEKWAMSQGCKRLESYNRPGITRKMAKLGMKKIYDVIAKPLGD